MEQMREDYFTETTLKHLDYLQDSISRMGKNSFQIKGWTITIVTAVLTFYASIASKDPTNLLILLPIVPTFFFWIVDASFLSTERKMRAIYNDLIKKPEERKFDIKPLSFPLNEYADESNSILSCMFCFSNAIMYGGIIICLIIFYFMFCV